MIEFKAYPQDPDKRASCDGSDPDVWFPLFQGVSAREAMEVHVKPLRRICVECPVRTACRRLALETEGSAPQSRRFGIFGGWTPRQRAQIASRLYGSVEPDPDVQGDLFDIEEAS